VRGASECASTTAHPRKARVFVHGWTWMHAPHLGRRGRHGEGGRLGETCRRRGKRAPRLLSGPPPTWPRCHRGLQWGVAVGGCSARQQKRHDECSGRELNEHTNRLSTSNEQSIQQPRACMASACVRLHSSTSSALCTSEIQQQHSTKVTDK
jgi:hypothetical protein